MFFYIESLSILSITDICLDLQYIFIEIQEFYAKYLMT